MIAVLLLPLGTAIIDSGSVPLIKKDLAYSINGSGDKGIVWKYAEIGSAYQIPTVADDGTVYLPIANPNSRVEDPWMVVAIGPNGQVKWTYPCQDVLQVVAGDGMIYVTASSDHNYCQLLAIGADGTLRWKWDAFENLKGISASKDIQTVVPCPNGNVLVKVGDTYFHSNSESSFFVCSIGNEGTTEWTLNLSGSVGYVYMGGPSTRTI